MSSQPNPDSEITARLARQVAQQSSTLALHVQQHDDINAAAQKRSDEAIATAVAQLREAHHTAVEAALHGLEETGREIVQSLQDSLASEQKHREEHDDAFATAQQELLTAFENAMAQQREDQQSRMDQALDRVNRSWSRLAKILVATTATAVCIGLVAVILALL